MKLPRVLIIMVAGASLASPHAAASNPLVPANDPAISYEGRYATDATGAVRLGFPGVTAHVRFRGSALTLRARASVADLYFDVSVDGGPFALLRLHQGEGEYPLVQGAGAGEHTVELTRRNESWQGTCELLGFAPGGGEILPAPALPARKMMFIGDSVTCGEMVAYEPGRDMKDRLNWNARVSYGMLLARKLGAQCALVSYGGRGVIRDWQGIRNTTNAPQFYELALPDDATARWDPRRCVPDAIGIQLGTNDFSQGIPDENEFVNAYVQFVEKIRRDAPGALIFLMDSPILDGPKRVALHACLEEIVAKLADAKVILAPLGHYHGIPANAHPTGAEHVAMAAELEPVVRRALGW
jgi:lysophospholipase L1-like esterase